jgi:hypothetical protein
MKPLRHIWIVVVMLLAVSPFCYTQDKKKDEKQDNSKTEKIKWIDPYRGACAEAKKENKPVVILVWDANEAPFRETAKAFEDNSLKDLWDKFVFLKIDAEGDLVKKIFKEASNNAPWVYVLDPTLDKPHKNPLAKVKGVRKKGGGIKAEELKKTLEEGLEKFNSKKEKK